MDLVGHLVNQPLEADWTNTLQQTTRHSEKKSVKLIWHLSNFQLDLVQSFDLVVE